MGKRYIHTHKTLKELTCIPAPRRRLSKWCRCGFLPFWHQQQTSWDLSAFLIREREKTKTTKTTRRRLQHWRKVPYSQPPVLIRWRTMTSVFFLISGNNDDVNRCDAWGTWKFRRYQTARRLFNGKTEAAEKWLYEKISRRRRRFEEWRKGRGRKQRGRRMKSAQFIQSKQAKGGRRLKLSDE